MNKNAVLIISHGYFAKSALDSAQMIIGNQENCDTMAVTVDVTLAQARILINEKIAQLDTTKGLIILVDIFGGTPSNISSELLVEREDTLVVSGVSLPILLELFLNQDRPLTELEQVIEDAHKNGFVNINKKLSKTKEHSDECQNL